MSDDAMVDEFKVEAAELFENAENSLLNIDKGEDFLSNYNNIFRAFHSLKGAAGMFGLMELQEHMHKLESLFEAQKKVATMNNKQVDYFLSGIDVAKKLLDGEEANFYHIEISNFNEIEQTSAPAAIPIATKPKTKLDRKRGVIFIVSDNKDTANSLQEILEVSEYATLIFATTDEAVSSLESLNPEVVFCGLQMIAEMKTNSPETPAIFISETLTQSKMKEAIRMGAYAFIATPFEPIPVLALCGNAINKHMTMKLVEKSVNYILYQFTDLDLYLKSQGKDGIRTALKKDLQSILEQRKAITNFSTFGE
jgi:chemotaxis protein histidine kinase CheA